MFVNFYTSVKYYLIAESLTKGFKIMCKNILMRKLEERLDGRSGGEWFSDIFLMNWKGLHNSKTERIA